MYEPGFRVGALFDAALTAPDTIYRVARTTLRGPSASDQCFRDWLANAPGAALVQAEPDPGNNGGPNDRMFYVWSHDGNRPLTADLGACNWDLMTDAGANGWRNVDAARAVVAKFVDQSRGIKERVEAANKAAVDPLKIFGDIVDDGADALKDAAPTVGIVVAVGVVIALAVALR